MLRFGKTKVIKEIFYGPKKQEMLEMLMLIIKLSEF